MVRSLASRPGACQAMGLQVDAGLLELGLTGIFVDRGLLERAIDGASGRSGATREGHGRALG